MELKVLSEENPDREVMSFLNQPNLFRFFHVFSDRLVELVGACFRCSSGLFLDVFSENCPVLSLGAAPMNQD